MGFDFDAEIRELALLEVETTRLNEETQKQIDEINTAVITPLQTEIDERNKMLEDKRAAIIKVARETALNTPNLDTTTFNLHGSVEIKRKPVTFMYDEAEIFAAIKAQIKAKKKDKAIAGLIRVKEELNKIELNKVLKANKYDWLQAEAVNDLIVTIRPLGDIAIEEQKKKEEQNV